MSHGDVSNGPFPVGRAFVLGCGFLGIALVWPIFNTYVPIFLKQMGMSATLIGFVMTWDNYINLFLQPMVGERSDRTKTRIGRRKPWILAGAPLAVVAFAAVPRMSTALGITAAILATNLALALFRSPAVALLGDLFPPRQRSQANGIINLMGGLGAVLAFLVGGWLYGLYGRTAPFLFGSVVLVVAMVVVIALVREPMLAGSQDEEGAGFWEALKQIVHVHPAALRILVIVIFSSLGYGALETWLSSFGRFTLHIDEGRVSILIASLGAAYILAAVPSGILAARFGRKRIMLIGGLGLAALMFYGLVVANPWMLVSLLFPAGICWALFNVNALPLVLDTGAGRAGALTGLYYFAASIALVLGPPAVGALVDATGGNYRVMFPFAGCAVAAACLLLNRLDSVTPSGSALAAVRSIEPTTADSDVETAHGQIP